MPSLTRIGPNFLVWYVTYDFSATATGNSIINPQVIKIKYSCNQIFTSNCKLLSFSFKDENKEELFEFCADGVPLADLPRNKTLIATKKDEVVSSLELPRTHRLSPCTHEEADTRAAAHLKDMVSHDHAVITLRTVDTDWVVIALGHFHSLTPILEELYVEFGTGKNYRQVYTYS